VRVKTHRSFEPNIWRYTMNIFTYGGVRFMAIPYAIGLFPGYFTVPLNKALILIVSERRNPEWQAQHRFKISDRIKQELSLPTMHQIMRHYQIPDLVEIEHVVRVQDHTSGLPLLPDGRPLWMTLELKYKNERRCVVLKAENPLLL
jgi:hypothetical protein